MQLATKMVKQGSNIQLTQVAEAPKEADDWSSNNSSDCRSTADCSYYHNSSHDCCSDGCKKRLAGSMWIKHVLRWWRCPAMSNCQAAVPSFQGVRTKALAS